MKIVYSYWNAGGHVFCNKEMSSLSNHAAKKLGYKTCLYTDKYGYDLLSSINYDEIIIFDSQLLQSFNKKIWSLGKILAMSLVNEPFIHLDFDVFLFKKIDPEIEQKKLFSLYHEVWINQNINLYIQKIFKVIESPFGEKTDINNLNSYNFSIVGGQEFKKINDVCKKIIDFAIYNKEKIDEVELIEKWNAAVLFEQIMIPELMLSKYNISMETIFPNYPYKLPYNTDYINETKNFLLQNFIQNKIVHLHGDKMEKLNVLKNYLI